MEADVGAMWFRFGVYRLFARMMVVRNQQWYLARV